MSRSAEERIAQADKPGNGGSEQAPSRAHEEASPEWTKLISVAEFEVYQLAIRSLRAEGVSSMLGGAFGLATYTGRWRNTKDIDFYVLPAERERAINALSGAGFHDYYETLAYDRGWIYRATRNGLLVDIIWGTPNRRGEVDSQWISHAGQLSFRTEQLDVVPAEELVWIKLYVFQRDRCDWLDVINLLYAKSASLNWDRLVHRLGPDLALLHSALGVFAWVCPNRIEAIPPNLRKQAGIRKPRKPSTEPDQYRIGLLDSRPWFAAFQPADRPMQL